MMTTLPTEINTRGHRNTNYQDAPHMSEHQSEIIISLQDRPYEMISSGVKIYEFRRRWRPSATTAYVYRSGKAKHLCALIEFDEPIYGSPSDMRAIAERMIPGYGVNIEEYFTSTKGGYAVPIRRFVEFRPVPLSELRVLGLHPPQYFTYMHRYPKLKLLVEQRLKDISSNPECAKRP